MNRVDYPAYVNVDYPNVVPVVTELLDSRGREDFGIGGVPVELDRALISKLVGVMNETVALIRDRLDLDVTSRLPSVDKIYIYTNEEFIRVAEYFGDVDNVLKGVAVGVNHMIFLRDYDTPDHLIHDFRHELLHLLARNLVCFDTIGVSEGGGVSLNISPKYFVGFSTPNGAFEAFNEAVTELIALEMWEFTRAEASFECFDQPACAYERLVVFLDVLIAAVSKRLRIEDVKEFKKTVYQAYFSGDFSVLKSFYKTMGRTSFIKFARLNSTAEKTELVDILKESGFSDEALYFERICPEESLYPEVDSLFVHSQTN